MSIKAFEKSRRDLTALLRNNIFIIRSSFTAISNLKSYKVTFFF